MNRIDRLRWVRIIPYVGKTIACINVVLIEFIVKATVFLASKVEASEQTVHLTDSTSRLINDIYKVIVEELSEEKPKGRLPHIIAKTGLHSIRLQRKLGVEARTIDYLV